MTNVLQPQFEKERQQTDDSLIVERGKTDASFGTYNQSAEGKTDTVVKSGRIQADEARSQRRSNADDKLGNRNDQLNSAGNLDQLQSEKLINNARKSEDRAIEKERSVMDAALEHERCEKERLMTQILSQEREETDKNLLSERNKTDIETKRSVGILKAEQAAHSETKSALTTREEFVAIVSHDLRNPIGMILSSAQILLEDELGAGIEAGAKQWLEIIKRNAETSLRLISDILDMERIVEGKIQLQLTQIRICDLIKESVESCGPTATIKSITLKAESLNIPEFISCDKDRISQVLSNLIGNALKFTPNGGKVIVTARETENEIEVSVSDTGPGIPDDQKNRIFERFAQIGNNKRSGLGLGLYISKTLVESHGGRLWVTSSFGAGSTFIFTLPKH